MRRLRSRGTRALLLCAPNGEETPTGTRWPAITIAIVVAIACVPACGTSGSITTGERIPADDAQRGGGASTADSGVDAAADGGGGADGAPGGSAGGPLDCSKLVPFSPGKLTHCEGAKYSVKDSACGPPSLSFDGARCGTVEDFLAGRVCAVGGACGGYLGPECVGGIGCHCTQSTGWIMSCGANCQNGACPDLDLLPNLRCQVAALGQVCPCGPNGQCICQATPTGTRWVCNPL